MTGYSQVETSQRQSDSPTLAPSMGSLTWATADGGEGLGWSPCGQGKGAMGNPPPPPFQSSFQLWVFSCGARVCRVFGPRGG